MSLAHDRNLLFGVLALQKGFLRSEQLVDALQTWALEPDRSFGDVLTERRMLEPTQRSAVERLVEQRLPAPTEPEETVLIPRPAPPATARASCTPVAGWVWSASATTRN